MNAYKPALQRIFTLALLTANLFVFVQLHKGLPSGESQASGAQDGRKTLLKERGSKNEPLELVELKVKNKALDVGASFDEDPDWLRDVSFKVKNRSGRTITYINLQFDFPETAATGSIMMHQVSFGQPPSKKSLARNPPINLKTNETLDVSFREEIGKIKELLAGRRHKEEDINNVVVRFGNIGFEDGTVFFGGAFYKPNPDPNSSQKWVTVTDQQTTVQPN